MVTRTYTAELIILHSYVKSLIYRPSTTASTVYSKYSKYSQVHNTTACISAYSSLPEQTSIDNQPNYEYAILSL